MGHPDRSVGAWLTALAGWATAQGLPAAEVVRALAAALVARGDAPSALVTALDERLAVPLGDAGGRGARRAPPVEAPVSPVPLPGPVGATGVGPALLGQAYEAVLAGRERRVRGAFFTPPDVARRLVGLVLGAEPSGRAALPGGPVAGPVVDPAVGGGAFLLAAAAALHEGGARAADVLGLLHGADIDPVAVAVADVSLRWWAERHSGSWHEGRLGLTVADALAEDAAWPPGGAAVVVGNPPFLGQLARDTTRRRTEAAELAARHGRAVHGYVDTSALFLLAALGAARPGARVVLVQPESVLVAEHAGRVLAQVAAAACLEGVWLGGAGLFPADVRVCAPVLTVSAGQAPVVRTWLGRAAEPGPGVDAARVMRRATWSAVTAGARGVPLCSPRAAGRVGDLATATAGFRDQYYGLAPWVQEAGEGLSATWPRLVTVGMIDPVVVRFGAGPVRFARARWQAPVLDLGGLDGSDPTLAAWVHARLVPKLVVATQSSVLEAAVDVAGRWVPSVPCVAVEAEPADLWHLAAVLNSAVATAWALERFGGAGLSAGAVKLSARQVLEVPLPADRGAWDDAAAALRDAPDSIGSLIGANRTMLRAYGLVGAEDLLRWWTSRLPRHLLVASGEFLLPDA
ncbi:MAG: N-6 DNA methylase [Acidimicrobiia bacterium]|nr:N-6 DNA methylase [Acidimicrobiia bacterium]